MIKYYKNSHASNGSRGSTGFTTLNKRPKSARNYAVPASKTKVKQQAFSSSKKKNSASKVSFDQHAKVIKSATHREYIPSSYQKSISHGVKVIAQKLSKPNSRNAINKKKKSAVTLMQGSFKDSLNSPRSPSSYIKALEEKYGGVTASKDKMRNTKPKPK